MWNGSPLAASGSAQAGTLGRFTGVQYTHYVREGLAVTLGAQGVVLDQGASVGAGGVFAGTASVIAMPISVHWNPLKADRWRGAAKPFVSIGIGPVFGTSDTAFVGGGIVTASSDRQASTGGHVGAGMDVHVSKRFSLGVNGGYNWMLDFAQPVGSKTNFSGPELGLSLGWIFGRGRPHTP
jgi:hypothetical protein